jgi:hypothetical protein
MHFLAGAERKREEPEARQGLPAGEKLLSSAFLKKKMKKKKRRGSSSHPKMRVCDRAGAKSCWLDKTLVISLSSSGDALLSRC